MGVYQEKGFNRLAKAIAILTFAVAYLLMMFFGEIPKHQSENEYLFIAYPIVSLICSAGAFGITRLIYWTIDGFKNAEEV